MMKQKRYRLPGKQTPLFNHGLQIGVLFFCLFIIIILFVRNTLRMNGVLSDVTVGYVQDVAYQLADDVSAHIQSDLNALELLADSVPRVHKKSGDDQAIQEFLNRKAAILDLNELVLIDSDRKASDPSLEQKICAAGRASIDKAFEGTRGVTNLEQESLLYTVPIFVDGRVDMVLAGVRNQDNVQALIQPRSFEQRSLTCIINRSGQVVISPLDNSPFMTLEDIVANSLNLDKRIGQMRENLENGIDGSFQFLALNGQQLILSYHSLEFGGWVLLMLVPADLVTAEVDGNLYQLFWAVGIVVILMSLFVLAVLRFYRSYNERLSETAFRDPLTGGMNNAAFAAKYYEMQTEQTAAGGSIVMFNIRGFKMVNENYGATAGNEVIRYIYKKMEECRRPGEFVCRSESDHFFFYIKESDPRQIRERIQEIENTINSYEDQVEIPYVLRFDEGVYRIDSQELELTIMQDRARLACQMQRESGQGGCTFYTEELMETVRKEQRLNDLYDESLKEHYFQVYLQPKVRLQDGSVGGAEALVRWFHPTLGMISPGDFIPMLEKNGKICSLDLYVFEEVCALQKRWMEEGRDVLTISVNLSRQHFRNLNFLKKFSAIAERYGIKKGMIELELTESIFIDDQQISLIHSGICEMHKKGFLCSLDDFGSGFSSLGMLKSFDVDTLKLDRRFFDNMETEKARNIIACLIELADRLNVQTVAEGIETPEQLEYLRQIRCDMIQGFIFSRPLSIPDFEAWRDENARRLKQTQDEEDK